MGAKRPALGFSRPTDNFCAVAWLESTVWWVPAIVPTTRSKLTGKSPSSAPHVPAPVWNSAVRLGLRYAHVVAQLEELQRKLRSSALTAALRIERGSNRIENP